MPLHMGRVLSMQDDLSSSAATEYRQSFLSPRREDYINNAALPKLNSGRPPPTNRAFLSHDIDTNPPPSSSSEYRLRYENYYPKRPYCYHAQPSHVFDYVLKPPQPRKTSSRLSNSSINQQDTEYQERFMNFTSIIPAEALLPPHLVGNSNLLSDTQRKKEHMTRSQYFHQLVHDNEKLTGGRRTVGTSEQRTAFQWPYHYPQSQQTARNQEISTSNVYQPYSTRKDIYEPLPAIPRRTINITE